MARISSFDWKKGKEDPEQALREILESARPHGYAIGGFSGKGLPALSQQGKRDRAEQQGEGKGADHETGPDLVAEQLVDRAEEGA